MRRSQTRTSLKRRTRTGCTMTAYDRLPPELRVWLANAILPWRPASAQAAYTKALRRAETPQAALEELNQLEARLIARDVVSVWGKGHPAA